MKKIYWIGLMAVLAAGVGGYLLLRRWTGNPLRDQRLGIFFNDTEAHADWMVHNGQRCNGAPFQLPTSGYIGYLWGDLVLTGTPPPGN